MNVLIGVLVIVGVTAVTVTAMLLVRRNAPDGSYFSDGDRASGVFGVLATGFAVILGFIIFLAFESYDASRAGAETEALTVVQQVETAQLMPEDTRSDLTGALVCYARWVVGPEWDAMDDGTLGDALNPWGAAMFRTVEAIEPQTNAEQSAYDRWLDQTGDREQSRIDRVHGVHGVIPTPLWIALYAIAAVIFGYMLLFADSSERAFTQAALMGSVTVVITALMLLLVFFDNPHGGGVGRLQPTEMDQSLRLIERAVDALGIVVEPPCDSDGRPR